MKIKRLAIANRGEVAVRIIRACEELGIHSILLHSECDMHTEAYRLADETVCIGGSEVGDSYLNIENTVNGAVAAKADAIHHEIHKVCFIARSVAFPVAYKARYVVR